MGVKTRLGIMSLVSSQMGSVELPEEVTFLCPECATQVADKGQCIAELAKVSGKSTTGFVVRVIVDCRNCGCYGQEPAVPFL